MLIHDDATYEAGRNVVGYVCEEHDNPADFFLDVLHGDATAIQQGHHHHHHRLSEEHYKR